ncbi:MAG: hypothetical protein ABI284_01010, partial [Nitrosospira sp.]
CSVHVFIQFVQRPAPFSIIALFPRVYLVYPFKSGSVPRQAQPGHFFVRFLLATACLSTPPGAYWIEAMPDLATRLFRGCCKHLDQTN